MVLVEFLKKESVNQGPTFKRMLRELLLAQLKIKHDKVRRFLLIESDFALNVLAKLQFFLECQPSEIQLLRSSLSDFPD